MSFETSFEKLAREQGLIIEPLATGGFRWEAACGSGEGTTQEECEKEFSESLA